MFKTVYIYMVPAAQGLIVTLPNVSTVHSLYYYCILPVSNRITMLLIVIVTLPNVSTMRSS